MPASTLSVLILSNWFLLRIARCLGLESYVHESGLEPSLLELVKMRASQINGCAYALTCIASKDARAAGETEQRLYVLSAWREAPFFTER
jgi:AhpD family alkylhydroperoxidase